MGELLRRLGGAEVVADPDPDGKPSPLRTYLECLKRTPAGYSHRVVIQDDALPCRDFLSKSYSALRERPDKLVAFFVPGIQAAGARRVREARADGERWAQIGGTAITPVVALAWPVEIIESFVRFAESSRIAARYTHDDPVTTIFVKKNKLEVWATVPSLVQHPDVEPSLIGKPHGAGKYPKRMAEFFVEDS